MTIVSEFVVRQNLVVIVTAAKILFHQQMSFMIFDHVKMFKQFFNIMSLRKLDSVIK